MRRSSAVTSEFGSVTAPWNDILAVLCSQYSAHHISATLYRFLDLAVGMQSKTCHKHLSVGPEDYSFGWIRLVGAWNPPDDTETFRCIGEELIMYANKLHCNAKASGGLNGEMQIACRVLCREVSKISSTNTLEFRLFLTTNMPSNMPSGMKNHLTIIF